MRAEPVSIDNETITNMSAGNIIATPMAVPEPL